MHDQQRKRGQRDEQGAKRRAFGDQGQQGRASTAAEAAKTGGKK
ncbi:hypothetical protein [Pseudoxanthomonas winnipegensis]|nr:hypothetical protein [Pseudoxanthomonas winnipegensis]